MKTLLTRLVLGVCSILTLGNYCQAGVVSFGSGSNEFNMEFVTIGNPGNTADDTGAPNPAGSVGYAYGIGKFEVSEVMIDKYNTVFGGANLLVISHNGRGPNKPATGVSWNEAARFVNWLNTSTGGFAAYKFTTTGVNDDIALWTPSDTLDYDATNPYRSIRATYVLPSYNEWYKAAYYDPSNGVYYDYPTGSNSVPAAVAFGNGTGINGNNEAVRDVQSGPADVTQAGGLSPYGVMGLGGNVFEWEESSLDLNNSSSSALRGIRGGSSGSYYGWLSSSLRSSYFSGGESQDVGFRVVSLSSASTPAVPEPSMMAIFGLGALGMAYRARRKAKA